MLTRATIAIFTLALSQPLFAHLPNSQTKSNFVIAQQNNQNNIEDLIKKGVQKYRIQQYQEALQIYQIALKLAKQQQNRVLEREVSQKIGVTQSKLGNYTEALQYLQLALSLTKEEGNRIGQASILNDIGGVYQLKGDFSKALDTFQQTLAIRQQVGDRLGEARTLSNIGAIYDALAKYPQAIASHQQALIIFEQQNHRQGIAAVLNNIGLVQSNLGKYNLAIELYQKSLAIRKEIGDRIGEGQTLHNIGYTHSNLMQNSQAIEYYQKALTLRRTIQDRAGEATTLNNLGYLYAQTNQSKQALEILQQALILFKELGDQSGEGNTLDSLGTAYKMLGQYSLSLDFYQQALAILRKIGDRSNEGNTLSNLGDLLTKQNQTELAIVFYKQSVNVRETIRKDILGLSQTEQKSYLSTIESSYRALADLLLKQDRILEAQQILDLLKVQELSGYFRADSGKNDKGADYQPPEQNFIALGNELATLQKLDPLTKEQEQRLAYLTNQESDRNAQFNAFLNSPEVQKQIKQLTLEKAKNVDLEEYNTLRTSLTEIKNAALFYPLILDDRLELILLTATTTPIRKTITIKREDFNKDISDFLSNLRDPSSLDVQADGQKFYNYLIKPFEKELQDANIQTIIYSPDGQLRYIPLAALHDGKQWLVERYRINNITASSLTNLRPRTYKTPRVLAAAATNSQNIKVGDRSISFGALPATKTEVEAIAALIPNTTTFIDKQFNKIDTIPKLQSNTIIHLATHGYFAIGKPEDSFIVFGDGDKATIADMKQWTLTNVSLVILSACETAIGGKLGNGIEILGLGYQIQSRGAGAAIASLWKVSDDGTKALMEELYKSLKQKVPSSEALRQAQIAMINSDKKGAGSDRAGIRIVGNVPANSDGYFSHPFYWSAFILIGNGL